MLFCLYTGLLSLGYVSPPLRSAVVLSELNLLAMIKVRKVMNTALCSLLDTSLQYTVTLPVVKLRLFFQFELTFSTQRNARVFHLAFKMGKSYLIN
jgi:hypothetical protein